MVYVVVANVTGEPAAVQSRDGQTVFYSRGEAEDFQRSLRLSGFDRVDIQERSGGAPEEFREGRIVAPASTPDRPSYQVPTTESQVVVDVTTGQNVPYRESSQAQFEQNLAIAHQQNKISSSDAEALRRSYYQMNFPTTQPISVDVSRTAGEAIAQLPGEYRTPENLRKIAEANLAQQQQFNFLAETGLDLVQIGQVSQQKEIQQKAPLFTGFTTLPSEKLELEKYYSPYEYQDKMMREGKLKGVDYVPKSQIPISGGEFSAGFTYFESPPRILISQDVPSLSREEAIRIGQPFYTRESTLGHELIHATDFSIPEGEVRRMQRENTLSGKWFKETAIVSAGAGFVAEDIFKSIPSDYRTPENLKKVAERVLELQAIPQQKTIKTPLASGGLSAISTQAVRIDSGKGLSTDELSLVQIGTPPTRVLTQEEQKFTPQGMVSTYKPLGEQPFLSTEKLSFQSTFGTPSQQLGAELGLGVKKAKQIPTLLMAGGFAGLTRFAPRVVSRGVGVGATLFSVKPLQEEIAQKGFAKTLAYELPTLGLFVGAERIGAGKLTTTKTEVPINLRFAQAAELKSVQSEQGRVIRINPVEFVAQAGKTKVSGVGAGKAIITEEGKLGATFQYQLETPKSTKETFVGVKGLVKETQEGFKSLGIFKQFSEKGKELSRGITFSRSQEIIGGEFPRYASKTLEFAPKLKKGELLPITGASSVLKKEFEVSTENFAGKPIKIETYSFFEKGASAERIIKSLPEPEFVKQARGNLPSSIYGETETTLKLQGKESLISSEFVRGLKQSVQQQIPKQTFFETFSRVKPRTITTRSETTRIKEQQEFIYEEQEQRKKQENIFVPISTSKLDVFPISQVGQFQQPKMKQELTTFPKTRTETFVPQKIGIFPISGVSQKVIQDVGFTQPPTTTFDFPKPPRTPDFPFPKIPPFIPPSRRKFAEEDGFGFFKKGKRRAGYTPSLIAEEFGLRTRKRYSQLKSQVFSGLEIRPLTAEYPKLRKLTKRKRR